MILVITATSLPAAFHRLLHKDIKGAPNLFGTFWFEGLIQVAQFKKPTSANPTYLAKKPCGK